GGRLGRRSDRRLLGLELGGHVDHNGVGVVQCLDSRRQCQLLHVNSTTNLQLTNVHANGLGNADGQALNLKHVQLLVGDATSGHSRSNAAQLDLDGDVDSLVLRDAGEIDMQDFLAQMVPLQIANKRLFDASVRL